MPEIVKVDRDAHAKNAGSAYGLKANQPTLTSGDQKLGPGEHADVWALPVDTSQMLPLQDLDPNSPTFGATYVIAGFDFAGDPSKIIR